MIDPEKVGQEILRAVRAHSLSGAILRGGGAQVKVVSRGLVVFGPATLDECNRWLYGTIGEVALKIVLQADRMT